MPSNASFSSSPSHSISISVFVFIPKDIIPKIDFALTVFPFAFIFILQLNVPANFANSPAGLACRPVSFFNTTYTW